MIFQIRRWSDAHFIDGNCCKTAGVGEKVLPSDTLIVGARLSDRDFASQAHKGKPRTGTYSID